MLQANSQIDPIVEILRLAYRRGLAIRQQPAEGVATTKMPFPTENKIVIKRAGSLSGGPGTDPTNRNVKEGISI